VVDLVKRLKLPDDWRQRLQKLAEHRADQAQVEDKRKYLQRVLRNLQKQQQWEHISDKEYLRQRGEVESQLDTLRVPETPDVQQAGETLEGLGVEWANAPKKYQRDMQRVIFEAIYVDILAQRVICVKP
jgi:hypothetical protein